MKCPNSGYLEKLHFRFIINPCLFVFMDALPKEGKWVSHLFRDFASCPGLALVTPPSRHLTWEQNQHFYLLGHFKSLHHNNSCMLIPPIARNLAGWTFVCPRRNLVHPAPENNHGILIVLRYSVDPLKAVSSQQVIPSPQAILKIRPPNSLDYRVRYEPLKWCQILVFVCFDGHHYPNS